MATVRTMLLVPVFAATTAVAGLAQPTPGSEGETLLAAEKGFAAAAADTESGDRVDGDVRRRRDHAGAAGHTAPQQGDGGGRAAGESRQRRRPRGVDADSPRHVGRRPSRLHLRLHDADPQGRHDPAAEVHGLLGAGRRRLAGRRLQARAAARGRGVDGADGAAAARGAGSGQGRSGRSGSGAVARRRRARVLERGAIGWPWEGVHHVGQRRRGEHGRARQPGLRRRTGGDRAVGGRGLGRQAEPGVLVHGVAVVASSGDLGISFGYIRPNGKPPDGAPPQGSPFFTIWHRASPTAPWRYIAE